MTPRLKVTIAIHTRNRETSVLLCLESIKKQTVLPDELIFIENVIEHQYFSKKRLFEIFPKKIRCVYKKVTVNNRATSRNLSLSLGTGDIYISIDHDAFFAVNSIIEQTIQTHKKFPYVSAVVGPVFSIGTSMYELFSSAVYAPALFDDEVKKIAVYPTTFFSLRMGAQKKYNVMFNVSSNAEDIDFFWRLTHKGGTLMYTPNLGVYAEFPNNLRDFVYKRFSYAVNNADLFTLSGGVLDSISWLLVNSKIKLLLYPVFFIYHLFKNAYQTILSKRISYTYMGLSFINELMVAIGFFASDQGKQLFLRSVRNFFITYV